MRTWPQIVMIIAITLRTASEIRRGFKENPSDPSSSHAGRVVAELIYRIGAVYVLAYGGFWSSLGWSL